VDGITRTSKGYILHIKIYYKYKKLFKCTQNIKTMSRGTPVYVKNLIQKGMFRENKVGMFIKYKYI
jgi:hypothetical protein